MSKEAIKETPKAAEAFASYVAMGPSRSLRKLAEELVRQNRYKTATTALRILQDWSVQFRWQERIAEVATQEAQRMLEEAAALDSETFLQTSQKLNVAVKAIDDPSEVVRIRESVRKPMPKGGTSVSVNLTVEIRQMVDRIAEEDGLTEEEKQELTESIERHLSGAAK